MRLPHALRSLPRWGRFSTFGRPVGGAGAALLMALMGLLGWHRRHQQALQPAPHQCLGLRFGGRRLHLGQGLHQILGAPLPFCLHAPGIEDGLVECLLQCAKLLSCQLAVEHAVPFCCLAQPLFQPSRADAGGVAGMARDGGLGLAQP